MKTQGYITNKNNHKCMCFPTTCTAKNSAVNPLIKKQFFLPYRGKTCICNCKKSCLLVQINYTLTNMSKNGTKSRWKKRTHILFSVSCLTQSRRNEDKNGTHRPRAHQLAPPAQVKLMLEFLYFYTWIKDLLFAIPFQTCSAEFLTFLVSQCDRNQKQPVLQKVITGTWPSFVLQRNDIS